MSQFEDVCNSKFYMLRCIVAIAHADGVICDEEHAYIAALMNRLPLTMEQRGRLERDFDEPQKIEDLFRYINDPLYRSQVLYFCRIMAYKDGVLDPSEELMLEKIQAMTTDGLDMETIRKEAQIVVQSQMTLHGVEINKNRPMRGKHMIPWTQLLDELLLMMGIDLMK